MIPVPGADSEAALAALREAFPASRRPGYFNYAATAPMLEPAARAMEDVARQGLEPMADHFTEWLSIMETTRRTLADAIGATSDAIAFTTGTSAALSLVAGAVRWKPGDRVLYPADEFPSNRFAWDNLASFGVVAEPVPVERGVSFAQQLAGRDLSGVRLVALSAVSYHDGRHHDVRAVTDLCRARGILVSIDAVQAVGAVPVDVRAWNCDFLACGGQKWLLGPVGIGFLYIAPERLGELHVPSVGWASSRHAGDPATERLEFCDGAARFEPGLPDIAAIAGLGASVALLAATGWSAVHDAVAGYNKALREELPRRGVRRVHDGEPDGYSGIVAFEMSDDGQADRLERVFDKWRIRLTRRGREFRVAAHATTHPTELGTLFAALDAANLGRRDGTPTPEFAPRGGASDPDARRRSITTRARHALVTGASRGLGEAIARGLARRGEAVTLIGRDAQALDAVAGRIARAHGARVQVVPLDLSDRDAVSRWIASEHSLLAGIDTLVNNAAWSEATPFSEARDEVLRLGFETNLFAPLALARATLPGMLERRNGRMLNVTVSGARNALPLFSGYAASKAALWAWSESLGRELAGSGVRVTTFIPPHMDTATRRQLGRRALGWYDIGNRRERTETVAAVAEQALEALEKGAPLAAPLAVRWMHAFNALAPDRVARQVARFWKRPGHAR